MVGRIRQPTMQDVADRAGVSRALVSIVFRDAPGAGAATRARVRVAALELGYQPDHRARLLGRARTGLIGVSFGVRAAFHADLVEALYAAAETAGYDVALGAVTPTRSEAAAVNALLAYRCEALICLGPTMTAAQLTPVAARLPVVVVAGRSRVPGVDVVRTDDAAGLRQGVAHLISLGHQRIWHVDGAHAPGAAERRRGYRTAMRRAGLADGEHILAGGLSEGDGVRAARQLLSRPDPPTAVAAFNDRCAVGLLHTLRAAGRPVPGEISLMGFDDDRLAALAPIALTTIRQDAGQLAARAIQAVLRRLADAELPGAGGVGEPAREQIVAPTLVVRATTGPVPT